MKITVELPFDTGELLEKALDKARDDDCLEAPDLVDTAWSTRQAYALVNVLKGYLHGNDASHSADYLVTIHVDQAALAGKGGRAAEYRAQTRLIARAIERALHARDHGCCRFPGCANRRYLHSHHVEHWSNGGETSLENLMLLCTKHHTLVHEGGLSYRA